MKRNPLSSPIKMEKCFSWFFKSALLLWIILQAGCIVISTAGTVATTAVKSTVSIAGHTAKTAIDVVTPDGDEKND